MPNENQFNNKKKKKNMKIKLYNIIIKFSL
jgi:hypothetical protein